MYPLLKKFLFSLNPESAHTLIKSTSKFVPKSWLTHSTQMKSKHLKTQIGDTKLDNPIGLAAGFDKNGEMLSFLEALGFGFLELGSITALPCQGNPKPRIFRLPKDHSLINRMGLPNIGADAFAKHMTKQKKAPKYGVNIAKTPNFAQIGTNKSGIEDFLDSFRRLYFLGNYIVFNLSCPNTDDISTFEDPNLFLELAKEIQAERNSLGVKKPILLKLSPDLNHQDLTKLIDQALKYDFDGFVVTNTTTKRPITKTSQEKILKIGKGGLSGKALTELANKQLKNVYDIIENKKILIGVGGIMNFADLLQKMTYGASLVQVYTGFIYEGPYFIKKLNEQLIEYCKKVGVNNYKELVGQNLVN